MKEVIRCKSFDEYIMAKRIKPREPKEYTEPKKKKKVSK